jgi:hypothetical protein
MNNRDWGIYLIPFLAALAIYFPLASGNKPPVTISAPSSEPGEAQFSRKSGKANMPVGAAALLAQFLGKDNVVAEDFEKHDLDFLIATVPDPIDSSLGYMFDRHVSAIQLAGQAAGYVPDRFDLPWRDREEAVIQQGKAIAENKLDRLGAPKSEEDSKLPRHQREPGVILFRRTESKDREPQNLHLLIVFLVGETPTVGIHKIALANAFDQFMSLCGWGREPKCSEIRLLAPTFSGSADSLQIAIEGWPEVKPRPKFTIVSGSATAISDPKIKQLEAIKAFFHTTVLPDNVTLQNLYRYLICPPINAKPQEIGLLVEGASGYGQTQISNSKPDAGGGRQTQICKSNPDDEKDGIRPLILTYPLHISQLRQAAERARGLTRELPTETPSLRPRNLRLSLEETGEATDVMPPFSQFEAFSAELVLSNILTTISREGIRYLGLFSTDVRDQLFLARTIRELAPNVVLFTSNADLIYLHSDVNLDFQGMLVVSSYPLFSRNQLWTHPFNGEKFRLQFPTDTAEGVYNAALALLGRPDMMLDYGLPFDYRQGPGLARTPPVWLSVVGKNDLWPVRLLGKVGKISSDNVYSKSVTNEEILPPISPLGLVSPATLFLLLGLSALFLLISLALFAEFAPTGLTEKHGDCIRWWRIYMGWLLRDLGDVAVEEHREQRWLYLFTFSATILTVTIIINRILLRVLICNPFTHLCGAELNPLDLKSSLLLFQPASLLGLALLELPILVVAIIILNRVRFSPRSAGHRGLSLWLNPLISAPFAILILALIYSAQINLLDPPDALFFYLRMLHPGSGLSPLMPVFFLGAVSLLWLVSSLRRLRLLEEFPARYIDLDAGSLSGVETAEYRIRDLLICPSISLPGAYPILLVVGVPCAYLFLWKLTPAIEGRFFYWVFGLTFFSVYLALAFSYWRLLQVWRATRDLLRRLAAHPMHGAFDSLTKEFPRAPRLSFSNPSTIFSALEFSVDQGIEVGLGASRLPMDLLNPETLREHEGSRLENLREATLAAQQHLLKSHREEAAGNWSTALTLRRSAQGRLSRAANLSADILKPYWLSKAAPRNSEEKKWFVLAEHFLAGRTAVFLHHLFLHLENLLFSVMAGLILMLLAVSSYPFQPSDQLLLFNWVVIIATVVLTVVVFVQINRNSVVSLLSGTDPGKVNWNQEFIVRLVLYGLVPVLALIGAQFPEGLKNIVSWFSASQGAH